MHEQLHTSRAGKLLSCGVSHSIPFNTNFSSNNYKTKAELVLPTCVVSGIVCFTKMSIIFEGKKWRPCGGNWGEGGMGIQKQINKNKDKNKKENDAAPLHRACQSRLGKVQLAAACRGVRGRVRPERHP